MMPSLTCKRIFLIVLDSFGIGELPDAAAYGDAGSNTLASISHSPAFRADTLQRLGLFNIEGVDCREGVNAPLAAYGRCVERSKGKDTTTGHWEIAGLVSDHPLPTYPDGFPAEVLDAFTQATGRGVLCNRPYSGTQVILDYGRAHLETGKLIVYTSADSVFQIAAHESLIPPEELYEICRKARAVLTGKHAVGRVIARPFTGVYPHFTRTANRHDFSLEPPGVTMLDLLREQGRGRSPWGKSAIFLLGAASPARSQPKEMRMAWRRQGGWKTRIFAASALSILLILICCMATATMWPATPPPLPPLTAGWLVFCHIWGRMMCL